MKGRLELSSHDQPRLEPQVQIAVDLADPIAGRLQYCDRLLWSIDRDQGVRVGKHDVGPVGGVRERVDRLAQMLGCLSRVAVQLGDAQLIQDVHSFCGLRWFFERAAQIGDSRLWRSPGERSGSGSAKCRD